MLDPPLDKIKVSVLCQPGLFSNKPPSAGLERRWGGVGGPAKWWNSLRLRVNTKKHQQNHQYPATTTGSNSPCLYLSPEDLPPSFFFSSNHSESTQYKPRLFNIVLPINNLALRHLSTWHLRPYWVPLGGIQPAPFPLLAHWSRLDLNRVVIEWHWRIPQSMLKRRDYWNGLQKMSASVLYWIYLLPALMFWPSL